jgi:hypothetical protein
MQQPACRLPQLAQDIRVFGEDKRPLKRMAFIETVGGHTGRII